MFPECLLRSPCQGKWLSFHQRKPDCTRYRNIKRRFVFDQYSYNWPGDQRAQRVTWRQCFFKEICMFLLLQKPQIWLASLWREWIAIIEKCIFYTRVASYKRINNSFSLLILFASSPVPRSGQTQKSNATSGFHRLELCKSLKRKPVRLL